MLDSADPVTNQIVLFTYSFLVKLRRGHQQLKKN